MASTVEFVKDWGDGIKEYKLTGGDVAVNIITLGGIIKSLFAPDDQGVAKDLVLGFDTPKEFGPFYFGALIGRFANRIACGKFSLDGKDYQLAVNNPPNHLHGGPVGFDKVIWSAEVVDNRLVLKYVSADGEENYPGELSVKVTYEVSADNELVIDYEATCDKPTIINLTNHAYFNLEGQGSENIYSHKVQLCSTEYTPKNANNIPTGEIASVSSTPFDLQQEKVITKEVLDAIEGGGYDHNFLVPGTAGEKRLVGRVSAAGRVMDVYTTQPGVQLYTGNFVNCQSGKGGVAYGKHSALCLETQNYPDAPNKSNFPSAVLRPGEVFHQTTWYQFSKGA